MATNPQVDSRAYAFAYLIRANADFPADFHVPEALGGFTAALFLPQEQAGMFGTPQWPARVLVLFPRTLLIATHPSNQLREEFIPLKNIIWIEAGNFLLDGSVRIVTENSSYVFRYNARDSAPVEEFLFQLRKLVLPSMAEAVGWHGSFYGELLDLKFSHAESEALDPEERVALRFFNPPMRSARRRWLFHTESWIPGDYLAFTDRRVMWITDRNQGTRDLYGTVAAYAAVERVREIGLDGKGNGLQLSVTLAPQPGWRIPLPFNRRAQATAFLDEARRFYQCIQQ